MVYTFLKPVASFNSSENYVQLGLTFNNQVIPSNKRADIHLNYNQHLVSQYASLVQQIFPMFYHTIFTAYVDVSAPTTTMANTTDNVVAVIYLEPQSFFVLQ